MKTWKLSPIDLFTLGMTIKGAWVYERMPEPKKLKSALARIATTYPYLTGKYDPETKAVIWEDTAVGTIPFEEINAQEHKVADICGNPRLAWSLVKPYDAKGFKSGKAQPFTAALAKLSDGVVLYVQAAHALMDAATFYRIVGQWAALSKGADITPMILDQSLLPSPDAWSKEETIARVIEQGWVKIGGKQALKMLWNLAKNNAVKETVSIEVSQAEIAALRKESGAGAHGVLSAIAAQKLYAHLPKHKSFKYITVVDMRDRFKGIDADFMGNISQAYQIGGDYELSQSVGNLAAEIADQTKRFVSSEAPEEMLRLSVCASGYRLPYFLFDPSDMNNSNPGTIYINNQLKFRACEIDWGFGLPVYAFPNDLSDMVKFWQPVAGGPIQIIYSGLAAKTVKKSI
ncbi:MAG: acyltransferase [Candidatus Cryptobacteroides sp.]|jgi:hypothetical protein